MDKPIFTLTHFNDDGTVKGTSYFYENLGGDQMDQILKTSPRAVISERFSIPKTREVFIPF